MYSSYKGPCFVSSYQRHYLSGIPDRTFWLKRFREAVDIFGKIVPTERKEGQENEKEPFTGAWSVCSVTNLSERLRINLHQTRSLPVRGFDPCSFLLDPKTKLKVLWNIFHYLLHFSPLSTFHFSTFSLSLLWISFWDLLWTDHSPGRFRLRAYIIRYFSCWGHLMDDGACSVNGSGPFVVMVACCYHFKIMQCSTVRAGKAYLSYWK